MKHLIYNAHTKETIIVEVPDEPIIETPQPTEPTLEERLAVVEDDTEAIAIVLADIVGVEL